MLRPFAPGRHPPVVGAPAPPFSLPDPVAGQTVTRDDFAGRDALVMFLRGTWCPFCREQLQLLADSFPRLEAAGIAVVAIACQSEGSLRRYGQDHPLPFPLLADTGRVAARAWGTHYWLSIEGFHLSHPALFFLDRRQRVTFAHVGRSMRDLPLSFVLEKYFALLTALRTPAGPRVDSSQTAPP